MKVITARNVNDALVSGIQEIQSEGVLIDTRNGSALEFSTPVTTVYTKPTERVLFSPERDANPFFHLMESMWMLAGRQDAKFVVDYAKQMVNYTTDGVTMNGAYGYRWRHWFGIDQVKVAVERLKKFPNDRRTVIQMWDGSKDLTPNNDELDHPCNTAAYFGIRNGKLDMTVTNRSNDMLWGAYGANAVHFSFLQEYIASAVGVAVGTYYQMSNNFHVYQDFGPWKNVKDLEQSECHYASNTMYPRALVNNAQRFLPEVQRFCDGESEGFSNTFLVEVAVPMREAYQTYKSGDIQKAVVDVQYDVHAADWKRASVEWLHRRIKSRSQEK